MGSLSLCAGFFRILLISKSAAKVLFFLLFFRLLFLVVDLSLTASICCVRKRSILPSSRILLETNYEVSTPEATSSTKIVT
jgi:hypothetical protein